MMKSSATSRGDPAKGRTQDKLLALLTVPSLRTVEDLDRKSATNSDLTAWGSGTSNLAIGKASITRAIENLLRLGLTRPTIGCTCSFSSAIANEDVLSNFPLLTAAAATKTEKKPQTFPLYEFVKP
ncbi:protein phosphatase 2C family protein [Striga asiatica]|uniref:Protein phosphatase 2C family protein n=1 Tax=Striga asiatica TaxID=4170 RepID=A0A5A7P4H1_STRAF|nr:protein phosphatase 2C family protein [Striga asiatica]